LHELQVHQIELEMQNDELRRSQLELDASRARYFNLYDLAPVGYCSVSEQGLILQANLAAATLLGATRATLVKQPISRFIFKADQDTWYLHRKSLAETGQAQSLELRLLRLDGTQVWVQVAASVANDAAGPPVILVVLSDVSDRKLMEAAMRESEARYRALVEWSPEAMLVHLGGKVIYANPAAVRILGAITATELEGKAFLDLIHPASHPTVLAGLKNVSNQRGGAPLAELRCLRLDGTVLDAETQSSSTSYDGKQVTITSLHDIGARKQADGVA
jgi:PAS domain S-box-containing protein